jgi:ABC-type molybdate transport system ATPase subunit
MIHKGYVILAAYQCGSGFWYIHPAGTGSRMLARITRRSWDDLGLAESMMIYAQVKSVALAPA